MPCVYRRIVQPLEDLPRVKKARIQFTIEKTEAEAEEVGIMIIACLRFMEAALLNGPFYDVCRKLWRPSSTNVSTKRSR